MVNFKEAKIIEKLYNYQTLVIMESTEILCFTNYTCNIYYQHH